MLAFGLAIIFMFVRLHGDGYDFPVKVANMKDELEFPRPPDRTYLEVSSLYQDEDNDVDDHNDGRDAIGGGDKRQVPGTGGTGAGSKEGPKFGVWHSQWHLGMRKKVAEEEEEQPPQKDEVTTGVEKQTVDEQANDEQEHRDERWIWMTNIWHNDGDCGSGISFVSWIWK